MALRAEKVDAMWEKLGFSVRGGDHVRAVLIVNAKIVAHTMRSHGHGKLDGDIPHIIRQKMYLNEKQFADAYECPMKKPEYFAILTAKRLIPEPPKDERESK